MKQKDVRIGMTVTTRIGAERCDVVVMGMHEGNPTSSLRSERGITYRVRRVGETINLPKRRSPAALQEL